MKKTHSLTLLFSIFFAFKIFAQDFSQVNHTLTAYQFNGNEIIENLCKARYDFNKYLMKTKDFKFSDLPNSAYIFNNPGSYIVLFDGIQFSIVSNKIKSINGIKPSGETLEIITKKLMSLDMLQFIYSQRSNKEYYKENRNLAEIYNADRQFFAVLKIMSTTVKRIAMLAKQKKPLITFEMGLVKLQLPKLNTNEAILYDPLQTSPGLLARQ